MNYYQKPLEEIFKEFETSPDGLSDREALLRLRRYGFNQLKQVKKTPLIFKFFSQFKDLLAIILIVGGLLALAIGEPRDCLIILGIVFINATIGFVQEYKAERILAAFKKHLPSFSKVIREGNPKKIFTFQIVPGDILVLEAGDAIPADARLIEAFDFKTNDLSLTGESHPQAKRAYQIKEERTLTDIDNMVFMGTSVAEGKGKAVVCKTGMETEFGKIAKESQKIKEEPTPLQKELTHVGKTTVKIALAIVLITLLSFYFLGRGLKESLVFSIAVAVAVVPEGLPAATSVALSLGAQRMLKKKALVKKLLHVESLGSVNVICTDKTGTLTTGEMTVLISQIPNPKMQVLFYKAMVLCNDAFLDRVPLGDPLEIALLKFAKKEINIKKVLKENPRVFEIPFSSKRKMMSVVCKDQSFTLYTKGACLEVLQCCKLNPKEKEKIIKENDEMAKKGLRVLAFAFKKLKGKDFKKEALEKDLTFLGLVGLEDPPREGVKEAIKTSQKAGIKVIMITGDYGLTAKAIAKQIDLGKNEIEIVTGAELEKMTDEELKRILEKEVIFARTDPGQKLRIVKNLKEMGKVVAVTGDGVNDAPALVAADIGVAMGKIGTDVAKEAADMILLDDHFATIVGAIKEGRRIFENAKKFVFYIFSSNAAELFIPLFALLFGLPLPLLAIQVLAIDLGTDVFPSLGLGVEKEEPKIMERPPRALGERIMNMRMLFRLLQVGIVMTFLGLLVYLITLYQGGWHYRSPLSSDDPLYFQATASVYATIVFCQVANAFSSRSEKLSIFKIGFWTNPWLIYSELISFLLLWGIIDFRPLEVLFRTAPPAPLVLLLIFLAPFIFLALVEWFKKLIRLKTQKAV